MVDDIIGDRERDLTIKKLLKSKNEEEVSLGISMVWEDYNRNDPYAIYTVGKWYRNGFAGLRVDQHKSRSLIQLSANQFVPDAVFEVGIDFDNGVDENTPNREKAFGYYVAAAIMGHLGAINAVVESFELGDGVKKDPEISSFIKQFIESVECDG